MLPVFTLGGFGAIWGFVRIATTEPDPTYVVWSPDHHYRASIVKTYGSNGCGTGDSSSVLVERQSLIFNTGSYSPFCFAGNAEHINLRWNDARTLSVECSSCSKDYEFANENWGKLHFVYDLDRP